MMRLTSLAPGGAVIRGSTAVSTAGAADTISAPRVEGGSVQRLKTRMDPVLTCCRTFLRKYQ